MPRKLSTPRPRMGAHLARLRNEAKLSQVELAELVGVLQQTIAYWEKGDKPPRSEVLLGYAEALGVSVETLLSPDRKPKRRGGPVGKVRVTFEEVGKLPRRQQEKVVEVVAALVSQYQGNGGGARA